MSLTIVAANVPADLAKYLDLQEYGEVASTLPTGRLGFRPIHPDELTRDARRLGFCRPPGATPDHSERQVLCRASR